MLLNATLRCMTIGSMLSDVQEASPILRRLTELDRSQGWLARRLGVNRSTVTRWVKGETPILPRRQRELALALGVSVDYIAPPAADVAA